VLAGGTWCPCRSRTIRVEEGAEDHTEAHATRARIDLLLAVLPPRQRITVALRVVEGYSEAETAQLMRCSTGAVKSSLARELGNLRTILSDSDSLEEAQS
jgi:RNA polymerase sigma factor (sigma-70 family)